MINSRSSSDAGLQFRIASVPQSGRAMSGVMVGFCTVLAHPEITTREEVIRVDDFVI